MPLVTVNRFVACQPFEKQVEKEVNKKKLAVAGYGQKPSVTELFVYRGTEVGSEFYVGNDDVVFVKSTCVNSQWAKDVFTFNGIDDSVEFILVPLSEIVFIDRDAMKECCDEVCNECREKAEKGETVEPAKTAKAVGEQVFPKKVN